MMAKQNNVNKTAIALSLDPGSSGDSWLQLAINGTNKFRVGVDDDASDTFKIAKGASLGGTDYFVMTAAGERTMPKQPASLATHTVAQNNFLGTGGLKTVNFTTEITDQNDDYDGTNTFTFPVTASYNMSAAINLTDLDNNSTSGGMNFFTSATFPFNCIQVNYAQMRTGAGGNEFNFCYTVFNVRLGATAGSAVVARASVAGMTADTVDIQADGSKTYFMTTLDC